MNLENILNEIEITDQEAKKVQEIADSLVKGPRPIALVMMIIGE